MRVVAAKAAAPAAVLKAQSSAATTYTVKAGDTVSAIAARHGLATASVLALNGLGWKSLIFPGQVLKLTSGTVSPAPSTPSASSGGRTPRLPRAPPSARSSRTSRSP